jgi:hypothetical protein
MTRNHVHKIYFSLIFDSEVMIVHQYKDVDGNPLLRGHITGTPAKDYIIFRPLELRYHRYGDYVRD